MPDFNTTSFKKNHPRTHALVVLCGLPFVIPIIVGAAINSIITGEPVGSIIEKVKKNIDSYSKS